MIFKDIDILKNKSFQVIIVGSGPAGITIAKKLEENKINSLIIEAGDEEYNETSQEYYKSNVFGDDITDLRYSRLRQLGGTSGHWGGWCKPMETWNINKWGLSYEEISKYQEEACKILEIKNVFNKTKIDNYFNQIEFKYSKVKFADKYKEHINKSRYINLILNTQITHFKGNEGKINCVEVINNKKKYELKSKIFVLCCGGIENSRILLWTKEINKGLLSKDLPVGRYWMTHPWIVGGVGFLYKSKLKNLLKDNFLSHGGPLHISTSKEIVLKKNILSGAMYMSAKEDAKIYKEIIKDFLCVAPKYGKKIARSIFKKDLKCGNIFMHLEEPSKIENKITLDNKIKDANGIPITNLYYKKSKESIIAAKTILGEFAEVCRKLDLGRIAISKNIDEEKDYESLGVYHHIGGTKIGTDSKTSVVDTNLKIHGSSNLYVAGSSVFPTSGYTNPTFTIVKLSLRLGEHIMKKII